jgi:hypothetical protein
MRRCFQFALLLLLLGGGPAARAGDVIDRVVATVNGRPILQSDWAEAIRCEAFLDGRPLEKEDAAAARATLDRLIDQELLRQQLQGMKLSPASSGELENKLQEVRKQMPEGTSDASWNAALERYGLTEAELKERLAGQLDLLRLVDARLRPTVRVDSASIVAYYREKFLPQLRKQGAPDPSLGEVTPKIEELLAQERLDTLLSSWLADLRKQSDIRLEPMLSGSATRNGEAR